MYTNWELDDNNNGCPVPDDVPTAPIQGSCTLGALPPYVVKATSADDISKAVKFAAKYNLRLRIKNTGHDYTGRSTAPGSFTIWTHNLQNAPLIKSFVPSGCPSSSATDVIAADPGVDVSGLYAAGAKNGVTTIGGFTPSVGAAGGYIIGGGTGPLAPNYGLGVDNVVQFDVVLADGTQTSANACHNSDLFWALRGGGGTFAVHTKVYIKAHPAFKAVNTVAGAFQADSKESFSQLITQLINIMPDLREKYGINGIWETFYPAVAYLNVQPFANDSSTPMTPDQLLQLFQPLTNITGITNSLKAAQFPTWNDAYTNVVVPTVAPGGLVGVSLIDLSRIVSNDMMGSQSGRDQLVNYILDLPEGFPFIFQMVGSGAVNVPKATDTPINPAWRTSFGFFDVPIFGPYNGISQSNLTTAQHIVDQMNSVFGTASYYNEEYPIDQNWQESAWGKANYQRLLSIKQKVDPNGVFSCRFCVGSEGGY